MPRSHWQQVTPYAPTPQTIARNRKVLKKKEGFDLQKALRSSSLSEFLGHVVQSVYGYPDIEAYWEANDCISGLPHIRCPVVFLQPLVVPCLCIAVRGGQGCGCWLHPRGPVTTFSSWQRRGLRRSPCGGIGTELWSNQFGEGRHWLRMCARNHPLFRPSPSGDGTTICEQRTSDLSKSGMMLVGSKPDIMAAGDGVGAG